MSGGHRVPVSPDKDHPSSEFVLEPGKDLLRLCPGLLPPGPVGLHRDLLPSPRGSVVGGTQPKPPHERPKGGGIGGGIRQTASQSLPRRLLEKKGADWLS